jgi:single stranded DNA-binding protein
MHVNARQQVNLVELVSVETLNEAPFHPRETFRRAVSVNKVILLGNLTRDPELRQTEHNKAVCSFGLATNRNWTTETGKKREEPEYHRLVA